MKAISRAAAWTGAALLLFTATGSAQQVDPASPQVIRAELDRLRQEFEALQQQYGDRFARLEARLRTLEGAGVPAAVPPPVQPPPTQRPPVPTPAQPPPAPATPTQPTEAAVPPGAAGAGGPTGSLPVYGSPSLLSKIFNPDIAVIGDFRGAAGKKASLKDEGASLLLTFWPSEFSQLRGQYCPTRYAEGTTANEFLFSIGAHGAHVF